MLDPDPIGFITIDVYETFIFGRNRKIGVITIKIQRSLNINDWFPMDPPHSSIEVHVCAATQLIGSSQPFVNQGV